METWMLVGLMDRFQPSDSLLKLNLVRPKVLQDVSCRNVELLVETLGTSSIFVLSDPLDLQCPSCNLQLSNGN